MNFFEQLCEYRREVVLLLRTVFLEIWIGRDSGGSRFLCIVSLEIFVRQHHLLQLVY